MFFVNELLRDEKKFNTLFKKLFKEDECGSVEDDDEEMTKSQKKLLIMKSMRNKHGK